MSLPTMRNSPVGWPGAGGVTDGGVALVGGATGGEDGFGDGFGDDVLGVTTLGVEAFGARRPLSLGAHAASESEMVTSAARVIRRRSIWIHRPR